MKALIVDDSRAIRLILTRIMKSIGFDVIEAEHGKAALQVLAEHGAFDIALFDWNMPEMDGLELLSAVRRQKNLDEMAIMMVTTETEISQVVRALEAGANEYLMKPFTAEAVVEKLRILNFAKAA